MTCFNNGSRSPTRSLLVYYRVPQFEISSMCSICIRAVTRLRGPTHIGVPLTFDEEGTDNDLFQQDQGYFAPDRIPFREHPVIVHFLAGHREALNRRHRRAGSASDLFRHLQIISHKLSSLSGTITEQTGNCRKRASARGPHTAIMRTKRGISGMLIGSNGIMWVGSPLLVNMRNRKTAKSPPCSRLYC